MLKRTDVAGLDLVSSAFSSGELLASPKIVSVCLLGFASLVITRQQAVRSVVDIMRLISGMQKPADDCTL